MSKLALLFLEYQNDFLSKGGVLTKAIDPTLSTSFVNKSKELLILARSNQQLIGHIPLENQGELTNDYGILETVKSSQGFIPGSWGHDFIAEMTPNKNEYIIKHKSGISAFKHTELNQTLKKNKITHLLLAGLLTHVCIESTVRDAYEFGYKGSVVKESVLSLDKHANDHALNVTLPLFAEILSIEEAKQRISHWY